MSYDFDYLMENPEESIRLELKTDPEAVRRQARWCGIKPGMRILDAGCGSGITASILYEMSQPRGEVVGVDYSKERIRYAREHYSRTGINFHVLDLRDPLEGVGEFDLIWLRFVLEYNRSESTLILRNLNKCLKPGGQQCLFDLDYNCLSHYPLTPEMESTIFELMSSLERSYNFDPYAGRKLYSYLFDLHYDLIKLAIVPHHVICGRANDKDMFNWLTKMRTAASRVSKETFNIYEGGKAKFFQDFVAFLRDDKSFTYSPLIMCKGIKPNFQIGAI